MLLGNEFYREKFVKNRLRASGVICSIFTACVQAVLPLFSPLVNKWVDCLYFRAQIRREVDNILGHIFSMLFGILVYRGATLDLAV